VFRIKPAGEETTLYSFPRVSVSVPGGTDAGLILASDGNFYGTRPATESFGRQRYCVPVQPNGLHINDLHVLGTG